jgi:hypothetical protein
MIGRDQSAVFIQGVLTMHRFLLSLSAATAVLTAGVLVPNSASATPLSGATGLRLVIDTMDPVENVAICFYVDGWNGPGLYDCGYRHRHGQGWHGRRDGHNAQGRVDDRRRRGDHNGRNEGVEWQGRR